MNSKKENTNMEKFKVCAYQYGIGGDIEVNEYDEILDSEQAAISYAKTITTDLNDGSDDKYYAIVKKLDDDQEFTIEIFSTYDKDVAFEVADIDEELTVEDGVYANKINSSVDIEEGISRDQILEDISEMVAHGNTSGMINGENWRGSWELTINAWIEGSLKATDKNLKKYAKEISTLKKLKKEKNITDETNKPLDEAIELVVGWLNEFEKESDPLKEDKKVETEKKNEEIDKKMDMEMDAPTVDKK